MLKERRRTCKWSAELYGLERLCTVISQHWELSAEAFTQAIIDDVARHIGQHNVYDDLTLKYLTRSSVCG